MPVRATRYPPPPGQWRVQGYDNYAQLYRQSIEQQDDFWEAEAQALHWNTKWTLPLCTYNFDVTQGPVSIRWFDGATTNMCHNCVDRHVEAGHGERPCFLCEGNEPHQQRIITYQNLLDVVCQIANFMKSLGIGQGDDVTIYMPHIPELPAAMLACARIGAVHNVVFAGFSAESLAGRILDSHPKLVITATGYRRGPKEVVLKSVVDEALDIAAAQGYTVEHLLVYEHATCVPASCVVMRPGRDMWWRECVEVQPTSCPCVWLPAEHALFKLYTSGSTGKPKGVVHTTGGYMVGAYTSFKYVFDHRMRDIYWCTADCGWITGHTYVTYGPLLNLSTQVLFEGMPTWPDPGRYWQIVDKYQVTVFYTAPTAIRALHAKGDAFVLRSNRCSLRLLGSVGEPINPDAWRWYYETVGDGRCPIVDTWWQTETGSHLITPLAGAIAIKPGSATLPFFGVEPVIVDDKGNELEGACEGYLAIKKPWPSMMRSLAGDHNRFEQMYFHMFKGMYFTGDGCRRDADGYYWITGRVDDVMNVSGQRVGTSEVESALVGHPACAEAAVVPVEHPIKGCAIYAFVTLMEGYDYPPPESLRQELIAAVRKAIGPIAMPDVIHWAPTLPKTRSGKIMRRILRKIAAGEEDTLGDVSTLADPSCVMALISLRGR